MQDFRQLLTEVSGIATGIAEPSQGQRYAPRQEFKGRADYFKPTGADYAKYCSSAGQRTSTFMVCLNEPETDGATRLRAADESFRPDADRLPCWNNLRRDGSPNPATLHHAMKVRAGPKYVITQWCRERDWRADT